MKKKKHVVVFVFGSDAVRAYDEGFKELIESLENGDGMIVKREFDTEAEVRAYQQGVEDMDGWLACCCMADEDVKAHPRIINRYV